MAKMPIIDISQPVPDGGLTADQESRLSIVIKLEWHLKLSLDVFDFLRVAAWVMTGEFNEN